MRTILVLLSALTFPVLRAKAAPDAEALFRAIREADLPAVRSVLAAGVPVDSPDAKGNTPLMAAAQYADLAVVKLLVEKGANVKAVNAAGATPLMRAATEEAMTRFLLDRGADVGVRSQLGNTALMIAARPAGNSRTVKLLLERGADVNATNVFGASALMAAAAAEDLETVRLLVEHGADVQARPAMNGDGFIMGGGRTPLMWAAFRGNVPLVRLLLERGARVNDFTLVGGPLAQAAWADRREAAEVLLRAGAQVDQRDLIANYTPLHWAASSEHRDPTLVKLLLSKGADPNAAGGQPVDGFLGELQTPLGLACKRGETPLVEALRQAGARDVAARPEKPSPGHAETLPSRLDEAQVAAAIRKAVPLLEKTALESPAIFLKHASKQGCISCHQQELPLAAVSLARSRRIPVNEAAIPGQVRAIEGFLGAFAEQDWQTTFHPEPAIGNGYTALALHLKGEPASAFTDSMVHQMATIQAPDGHWAWNLPRPPIQAGDITATALAALGLKVYAPPGRRAEFAERVRRARDWLEQARPDSSEERSYQLLGLAWTGASGRKVRRVATDLIGEQRPDGGWAQLPGLSSDAYATSHALFALLNSRAIPARHASVRQGVRFLLRTQLADGSWHVRRRAFPFQPPMDSAFPHGADSWISAAATSWAVMGLSLAIEPVSDSVAASLARPVPAPVGGSGAVPVVVGVVPTPGAEARPVSFAAEIQPLLERSCLACHSGERAKGRYRMETREAFLAGGNRGDAAVVPGRADRSPLLQLVTDRVEDQEMPPLGRRDRFPGLTPAEVSRLEAWIAQGAVWPDGVTLSPPPTPAAQR